MLYLSELCVISLLSARAPDLADAYYYHIPTIEWVHRYGAVKGLASLMPALGFNGSLHSLSALVDWSVLGASTPLHTVSGYSMIILLLFSTDRLLSYDWKKTCSYSIILNGISIILVLIGTAWISSPVLDMPVTCLLWPVLILWCEIVEKNEPDPLRHLPEMIQLCFFFVFAVTIKLSAAVFVLLAFYPAYLMIKDHKILQVFEALGIGLLIAAPFLIRNVLISGWLLFPSSFPDISDAVWKLPESLVNNITGYATRGSRDPGFLNRTDIPWVVQLFIGSSHLKQFLYIVTLLMFIAGIFYIFRQCIKKDENKNSAFLYYYSVLMIGLVYWFLAAPDTRFGWFYIFPILVFPVCGYLGLDESNNKELSTFRLFLSFMKEPNHLSGIIKKGLTVLCVVCLSLYTFFYLYRSSLLILKTVPRNLITQTSFSNAQEELFGEQQYKVIKRGGTEYFLLSRPGYKYFPAAVTRRFSPLGDSIKDGFCYDPEAE
ncbi:MAG: hypothetical protein IJ873_04345 [Lachnospiraceae bacterium]|nr:hypothetical protein [Lachnospiraceae bacterium]